MYDQLLESFPDITASKSTVKRARRELGWVTSAPKYCQLIRDNNKQKRLDWCRKVLDDKDEFRDVIWTDKSTVMIDPYSRIYYRKRGEARNPKARPKLASFPGSPSFRAIIPCMTFDPPQRKAEGEPGRFCHMTRVMIRHPYIRYRHERFVSMSSTLCIVGIGLRSETKNLC